MNKGKLVMVVLAMTMALPCFAKRKIPLRTEKSQIHRSIFEDIPVQAWVEDNNKELLLEFSGNLGTLQVTVTNSAGRIVYNQTVETDTTPSLIVTLSGSQNAETKISISDGENFVYGELNLKNKK